MNDIINFPSTARERKAIKKMKRFAFSDPKIIDLIRMLERIHKEAPPNFDAIHTTVLAHFRGLDKKVGNNP